MRNGKIKTEGGVIFSGKYFDIRQDYEIPIRGFFVISSKRHIIGFADFTEQERKEFINVLCKLRKGMKNMLKINFITLLHREDIVKSKTNPSHFHAALLPKYDWMKKSDNVTDILDHAKKHMKTKSNGEEIIKSIEKMRKFLEK